MLVSGRGRGTRTCAWQTVVIVAVKRYVIGGLAPSAYNRVSDDIAAVRPARAKPEPGAAIRYHSQAEFRAAVKLERDRRAALGLPYLEPRKPRKNGRRRLTRKQAAARAARLAAELAALDGPTRLRAIGITPDQEALLADE